MPFRYSSEFRHKACERMLAGEAVKELAAELSVSDATLYKWRRQALVDAGRRAGAKSFEVDPRSRPGAASRTSRPSSNWSRKASALFDEEADVSPKVSTRLSEG